MDKLKKKKYDSIQVKPSYIETFLLLRIICSFVLFFLSWLLFLALYTYIAVQYEIFWLTTIIIPLSVVSAILPSLALILSEWILKGLTKKWMYSRFCLLERFFKMLIFETIAYFVGFFYFNWKFGPLPLWTSFITLVLLGLLLASVVMSDLFNYVGDGVLSLLSFLEDFKGEPSKVHSYKLFNSAQAVSQIAKSCNFEVSCYPLSLGMTVSFLEDSQKTQEDFGALIEWMEDPTSEVNFKKFRKLMKRFNSAAKKSSKDGITEKHHWSFETKLALLGAIVIPITITLLATIVPGLIQAYLK